MPLRDPFQTCQLIGTRPQQPFYTYRLGRFPELLFA